MKRIVTHLLVAVGLAAGACGIAQAHTSLDIGLSLGAPAPVYQQAYVPPPVYGAPGDGGYYHHWDHRDDWHHRDDHGYRGDDRGYGGYSHGYHG